MPVCRLVIAGASAEGARSYPPSGTCVRVCAFDGIAATAPAASSACLSVPRMLLIMIRSFQLNKFNGVGGGRLPQGFRPRVGRWCETPSVSSPGDVGAAPTLRSKPAAAEPNTGIHPLRFSFAQIHLAFPFISLIGFPGDDQPASPGLFERGAGIASEPGPARGRPAQGQRRPMRTGKACAWLAAPPRGSRPTPCSSHAAVVGPPLAAPRSLATKKLPRVAVM